MERSTPGDVVVIGRVGADFPPDQIATPLSRVTGFSRSVGGFGGNVSTALARLGASVCLVACVGDDGHGRFIRQFLTDEGVDVTWLRLVSGRRTSLAFFEVWPPDRFPITFYPSATYWSTRLRDLPLDAIRAARFLVVSGTALAREPGRSSTRRAMTLRAIDSRPTVLDLDWRPALWSDATVYRQQIHDVLPMVDIVIGGAEEFGAARIEPSTAAQRAPVVVTKRGAAGITLLVGTDERKLPGIPVETLCGLGAGDAFIAAFIAALLAGLEPAEAAQRGNAAGAIVSSRLTCSTAMPQPGEIDDLIRSTHAQAR